VWILPAFPPEQQKGGIATLGGGYRAARLCFCFEDYFLRGCPRNQHALEYFADWSVIAVCGAQATRMFSFALAWPIAASGVLIFK
jgi:hypothetical protein